MSNQKTLHLQRASRQEDLKRRIEVRRWPYLADFNPSQWAQADLDDRPGAWL